MIAKVLRGGVLVGVVMTLLSFVAFIMIVAVRQLMDGGLQSRMSSESWSMLNAAFAAMMFSLAVLVLFGGGNLIRLYLEERKG